MTARTPATKTHPTIEKAINLLDRTFVSATFKLLDCLATLGEVSFGDPYGYVHLSKRERELRAARFNKRTYYAAVRRCVNSGWVKKSKKNSKLFLKLTKAGELHLLLTRLRRGFYKKSRHDGKWWLVVFDIPESARLQRYFLRRFLRSIRFTKLQKSVYISPYPIPKEAFDYLEGSELKKFLRFMCVTHIDNMKGLARLVRKA